MNRLDRQLRERRSVVAGVVLMTIVVVTAGVAIQPPAPASLPEPTAAAASPRPSVIATPLPSDDSGAGWDTLSLAPFRSTARMSAVQADGAGVAATTAFRLTSTTAAPAVELAAGLVVDPPIELAIEPGSDASEAVVTPVEPLEPGADYRFQLRTASGSLDGSWLFHAAAPLHVVVTLPDDQATGVPVASGIELTFDQDGVTGAASHVSIEPPLAGRFEQHGRTLVFVPAAPLQPSTLYGVTLSRGVSVSGSSQVLETDVRFRFETAATDDATRDVEMILGRRVLEVRPDETAVVGLIVWTPEETPRPTSTPVEVYGLPTVGEARSAMETVLSAPAWATWSAAGLVRTAGLSRVAAFTAAIEPLGAGDDGYEGRTAFRFPMRLKAGWYLVVVPRAGRDLQLVLQVTDVAVYALSSQTRSLAWVNDLRSGQPLRNATVSLGGGPELGSTDDRGLLQLATPPSLLGQAGDDPSSPQVLLVRTSDGRTVLAPLGLPSEPSVYSWEWSGSAPAGDPGEAWWLLFGTDRTTYRQTDQVNAWGIARRRDDGAPATGLRLEVVSERNAGGSRSAPALAEVAVTADARGVFAGTVPVDHVPQGQYVLRLVNESEVLAQQWFSVEEIRKPAYRLEITTDRHIYLDGEPIHVAARADFYDGTAVPGLELEIAEGTRATTDLEGRATADLVARADQDSAGGWTWLGIDVGPTGPEEGDVRAHTSAIVFPSSRWLSAAARIDGRDLVLTGTLSTLDRAALERTWAETGEIGEPAGPPVARASVTAKATEIVPIETLIGQSYDFIEKRAVPIYRYDLTERPAGDATVTTAANGTFSVRLPIRDPAHEYQVTLRSRDAAGRPVVLVVVGRRDPGSTTGGDPGFERPYLELPATCGMRTLEHGLDEPFDLTMRDGHGPLPTGGTNRYLFMVAHQGLREATIQASSTFTTTLGRASRPNESILAVALTPSGYLAAAAPIIATLDPDDRRVDVDLEADRASYRPGESVTVLIRTTMGGRPIPASVVVRAVDEKLYDLGGAADSGVEDLYAYVSDGLLRSYGSHQVPLPPYADGCGDTTGGGRDDFRDTLLFRRVATDASGSAEVRFRLSDDLTAWRIGAVAVGPDLETGRGSTSIPVGLPFFADVVVAPEYLAADRPIVVLRAYGGALRPGQTVSFEVEAPSLGLAPTTLTGRAFEGVRMTLPGLRVGTHALQVSASVADQPTLRDSLTKSFRVVASRSTSLETRWWPLTERLTPEGGPGLTTYTFSDAGRGHHVATLEALAGAAGPRLDRAVAAEIARRLLVAEFGRSEDSLAPVTLDVLPYVAETGGLRLVPYGGADLELSVLIAAVAGERAPRSAMQFYLREIADDPATTRERRIQALVGLVGLGADGPNGLRRLAESPDLTIRESLWLALGLATAGDDESAIAIERRLLEAHGQRRGPWIRLAVGTNLGDTIEATSLLALVAATVGDPVATEAEAYVEANQAVDRLFVLHQAAYIERSLARTPADAASFAVRLDGGRTVVNLEPGGSFVLEVSAGQRAGLELEPLTGAVGVSSSWTVDAGAPIGDPPTDVRLQRSVSPGGTVPADRLLRVTLTVTFGPTASDECYLVTDLVPSGFAPLPPGRRDDEDRTAPSLRPPDRVAGQRVEWCVSPAESRGPIRLGYAARVVSPGTYRWQPATLASELGGGTIEATLPASIRIE